MMSAVATEPRILIAGIGNIFLGDDAFGVAVVRRLLEEPLPPGGSRVIDFGIRGFDLACAILQAYDAVILVDATRAANPLGRSTSWSRNSMLQPSTRLSLSSRLIRSPPPGCCAGSRRSAVRCPIFGSSAASQGRSARWTHPNGDQSAGRRRGGPRRKLDSLADWRTSHNRLVEPASADGQ